MIYSQICVNFKILGNNRDNWAKGEYTKLKMENWNIPASPKLPQTPKKPRRQWISLKQAHSRLSEVALVTLSLFTCFSSRRVHYRPSEKSLKPKQIRLNKRLETQP